MNQPMSYNWWLYAYSNPINLTDAARTNPIDDIVEALRHETKNCYNDGNLSCVWRNYYVLATGGSLFGYTHASFHLFRYLLKQGDINYEPYPPQPTYVYSSYWVSSSNVIQTELPNREQEILDVIHSQAKNGLNVGSFTTDSRTVPILNREIDRDLYYAMNQFILQANVDYEVSGCYDVIIKLTYRFWDTYDWHPGLGAGGPAIGAAGFQDA